jgi:response regulator RpfG family c-di-GMP phosphodiesterase
MHKQCTASLCNFSHDNEHQKLMEAVLRRDRLHVYTAENGAIALELMDTQALSTSSCLIYDARHGRV